MGQPGQDYGGGKSQQLQHRSSYVRPQHLISYGEQEEDEQQQLTYDRPGSPSLNVVSPSGGGYESPFVEPRNDSFAHRNSRRQDSGMDGVGTKSCLAFRFPENLNFKNKKKRSVNSKAATSQSSSAASSTDWLLTTTTPPPPSASQPHNYQSPKPHSTHYSAHSHQRKNQQQNNNNSSPISHLLTPPTPEDRSIQRRLSYENSKRRAGLYEGELEPEGVRGQEAALVSSSNTNDLPAASNLNILNSRSHSKLVVVPEASHESSYTDDDDEDEEKKDDVLGRVVVQQQQRQQHRVSSSGMQRQPESPPRQQRHQESSSQGRQELRSSRHHRLREQQQLQPVSSQQRPQPPLRLSQQSQHYHHHNQLTSPGEQPVSPPRHHHQQSQRQHHQEQRQQDSSSRRAQSVSSPRRQDHSQRQQPQQPQGQQQQPHHLSSSRQHRESSFSQNQQQNQPQRQNHQQSRSLNPRAFTTRSRSLKHMYSDADSTCSDDDIKNMLPDLVDSNNNNKKVTPNLLHSDSAVKEIKKTASNDGTRTATTVATSESSNVDAINKVAMQHVQAGEFDLALSEFARVLQIQLENHGSIHPATASAYHNLGTVHAKRAAVSLTDSLQQRHCRAAALECFQAAARSARDSLHPNHPNVAVSLVRVGFLLLQSRQYENAITTFQEALRIRVTHYGEQHGLVANLFNNLGVCSMHLGQFEQGRRYLEEALKIQRYVTANDSDAQTASVHKLELADTLFNIGGLCLEWIRRQGPDARRAIEAESAFSEAYDIRAEVLGPKDPLVLQVRGLLDMARAVPRPRLQRTASKSSSTSSVRSGSTGLNIRKQESNDYRGSYKNHERLSTPRNLTDSIKSCTGTPDSSLRGPPQVRRTTTPDRIGKFPNVSPIEVKNDSPMERSSDSIFRSPPAKYSPDRSVDSQARSTGSSSSRGGRKTAEKAPVLQITVSKEEDDDGDNQDRQENRGPRVFVSPHLIPESPKRARRGKDHSDDAVVSSSYEADGFARDTSSEANNNVSRQQIAYSYDVEENCLISDVGVDSEHGRIHYPHAWNKAGIPTNGSPSRDIMVAQPFRGRLGATPRDEKVGAASCVSSDRWGSETVNFSTGNKDRDDIMARARAILLAHSSEHPPSEEEESIEEIDSPRGKMFHEDLLEDGVAPLGGSWDATSKNSKEPKSLPDMLRDPMNNLKRIHEEASRQLKKDNFVDAENLFEVVLQCQRRRHGPLHPDVAAALHNIGIARLRAQNHDEALKAFEEAARVRKGSLGKDHPLVAVSLVKVGITLLLLQRFDEALWSFREALSVRKHALGSLHPSTARIYNNIGCVYVEFNEFREARRAFEAALDVQRNALCHDPDSGPLMFGTATTLCNLGYLYRYRDMHAKAASVLKEAVDLQESVLGRSHGTVLSTLDSLADSCANSGNAPDALKYYNVVLGRYRVGGGTDNKKIQRAEAVLLYKMSRVHRQQNDRAAQLDSLRLALRSVRAFTSGQPSNRIDILERKILYDIRACREQSEREDMKWL